MIIIKQGMRSNNGAYKVRFASIIITNNITIKIIVIVPIDMRAFLYFNWFVKRRSKDKVKVRDNNRYIKSLKTKIEIMVNKNKPQAMYE